MSDNEEMKKYISPLEKDVEGVYLIFGLQFGFIIGFLVGMMIQMSSLKTLNGVLQDYQYERFSLVCMMVRVI